MNEYELCHGQGLLFIQVVIHFILESQVYTLACMLPLHCINFTDVRFNTGQTNGQNSFMGVPGTNAPRWTDRGKSHCAPTSPGDIDNAETV